jgi:ABC-type branched-subunit amino acid transport system ATPase component
MPTSPDDPRHHGDECLAVHEITVGYDAAPIVSDVSLTVANGNIVTIIGPNGAGKSTLLKALTGRLRPVSGRVLLDGRDVTGAPGNRLTREGLGYVPQMSDVFSPLTVQENLEMGGYLLPRRKLAERIDHVLSGLPLLEPLLKRPARTLSGGERKLLAIGRCLVLQPKLLILDEPTANLSPIMARMVLHDYVTSLAKSGTAILLVEQKARDAMQICEWCYVLVAGRVVVSSAPAPLLAQRDFGELYLGAAAQAANATDQRQHDSPDALAGGDG